LNDATCFEVINQACINCGVEIGDAVEPSADELTAGLVDKGLHLGMTLLIAFTFNEDEAGLALSGGTVELLLRWR